MQEFHVIDEYDVNLKTKGNVWSYHEMIGVMLSLSLIFFGVLNYCRYAAEIWLEIKSYGYGI